MVIELVIQVPVLDKAVCISLRSNAFEKTMNPSVLLKNEETPPQKKNNRAKLKRERERERERELNPLPSDTVSNILPYYSRTSPSMIVLSIPQVQRVSVQPSLNPSFIVCKACWSHVVNMDKYCGSSAYLFSPYIKAPHIKDELFYGSDMVSHYCLYY